MTMTRISKAPSQGGSLTSNSTSTVAIALAACRISPPVRYLTAPIDARVSPGAGKGSRSVKHLLGEVSGPSAPWSGGADPERSSPRWT